MLQITDSAAKRLRSALSEDVEAAGDCFRIAVTEEGARLLRDEQRPDDVTFEHEETLVLVVDAATADVLKDRKIDFDEETSELVFA